MINFISFHFHAAIIVFLTVVSLKFTLFTFFSLMRWCLAALKRKKMFKLFNDSEIVQKTKTSQRREVKLFWTLAVSQLEAQLLLASQILSLKLSYVSISYFLEHFLRWTRKEKDKQGKFWGFINGQNINWILGTNFFIFRDKNIINT